MALHKEQLIDLKALPHQVLLNPVPESATALVLAQALEYTTSPILHIARDDKRLQEIASEIRYFSPKAEIIILPAWDCLPYDRVSPSMYITSQRIESLSKLAAWNNKRKTVILTTVNSAIQRVPPKSVVESLSFVAKLGDSIKRDSLCQFLVKMGYIASHNANEAGEFAQRGSIIDIIPSGSEEGLRLDFFGDELESIRVFDPLTQVSTGKKRKEIILVPASEVILDEQSIKCFRKQYRAIFGNVTPGQDPLYDAISEGRHFAGMEHWLPLFYDSLDTVFDYLPEKTTFSFDYLTNEARHERLETVRDYYQARKAAMDSTDNIVESAVYKPIELSKLFLDEEEWNTYASKAQSLYFTPFKSETTTELSAFEVPIKATPDFHAQSKIEQKNAFDLLQEHLSKHVNKINHVVVTAFSEGSRSRLDNMLKEHDIHASQIDDWKAIQALKKKHIGITTAPISKGFQYYDTLIITEQDILGERLGSTTRKRKRSENFLMEASSLSEGELVVHKEYGIGRFEALETITVAGESHDCLRVIYDGGDKVFVPVENIDALSRYGSDADGVRLDKLGSTAWQARKSHMKKRIKMMAEELMKIAANRALKKAPALHAMEGLYEEFCARFPYAETEDQLAAIEDIVKDMSSGKPMDRLVCGDVGFGKTEVALRAAFIAASAGMQVAVIAPTTLLCRQHYQTFKKRFADMPFEIRQLSRLTSAKDAKETRRLIEEGGVDIVTGTHALLAKSVKFKNLGLVIIDEEQLFGVKHKERFKQYRNEIHMLALSATPIPRTLQMSLSGMKELSIIATPPVDRLAIRTFSMPFDTVVIRNAILREYYRGGHTFFVVPRINDLDEVEKKLRELIPEVKMVRAHGQLPASELDRTMNDFYDGKYDVLLSTNIIGSGIDLPTANTIIVWRADKFGLAQLYQMRGRVGRGKTRAYAYFTMPPKKRPNETAIKRLEVIQNLDTLGAGFTLASHDMDIRGFGNLLGEEQSGQIKEVGVELYQQMLRDAIEATKAEGLGSEAVEEHFSPIINLGISVLIPEDYVKNIELRLSLYHRIANAENNDDIESIAAEMVDRFGAIPEPTHNLLEVMKIKLLCIQANIEKIDAGPKGIIIKFYNDTFKNPEALITFIGKNRLTTKLRGDQKLVLLKEWKNASERLNGTKKSLENIVKLAE